MLHTTHSCPSLSIRSISEVCHAGPSSWCFRCAPPLPLKVRFTEALFTPSKLPPPSFVAYSSVSFDTCTHRTTTSQSQKCSSPHTLPTTTDLTTSNCFFQNALKMDSEHVTFESGFLQQNTFEALLCRCVSALCSFFVWFCFLTFYVDLQELRSRVLKCPSPSFPAVSL